MKFSINTLTFINKHYSSAGNPAQQGVDVLVQKIGAQLGAVEEVVYVGSKYDRALVVKVVDCQPHPNADRLRVCMIDDGGAVKDVERNEQGLVQVVCGAPNARAGISVVWLPPGATVPSTFDNDPFVLGSRELRGVVSSGMLASPKELSISDNHEGILEIDEEVAPGTPFATAFNLENDAIIDIENKMFTHRPDCFGWLGVAREIEGINHRVYKSPDWYRTNPEIPNVETEELKLEIRNEIPNLVPRFSAIVVSDVEVGPSPVWLQIALSKVGVRPINNIVDYTNFFMLETGQPMHAYDYDKVLRVQKEGHEGAVLGVRHPRAGEKLKLLNSKEIEPRPEAILITAGDVPIGLGGVMGGVDTEVDENTQNIIIESANFDMYSIRRTSMAHGLFTDAVTRFNKGQSPLQTLAALAKMTDEVRRYASGKVASPLVDDNHLPAEVLERQSVYAPVAVTSDFVNARLGLDLSATDMQTLLQNVEFKVDVQGNQLTVTAPFWRTDIQIREDIVEEVGRLYGFDQLPLELPHRDLAPASKNSMIEFKKQVRDILSRAGANEVLSYSFVHGNLLDKAEQDKSLAFQIGNALSPDLQYYRMSLTPSLLERVHLNLKAGYDEFALFEMNKTHNKLHMYDDEGVPVEFPMLGFVYAASDKQVKNRSGAAYYQAKKYLTFLTYQLGINLTFTPILQDVDFPSAKPYDLKRSALVGVQGADITLGIIGELKQSVVKALKLPRYSAGFEIGLGELLSVANKSNRYTRLPRFPKVEQDISLRVPADAKYQDVYQLIWQQINNNRPDAIRATLSPVDIYQNPDDASHKHITLRLIITSYERTLVAEEVNKLLDIAATAAAEQFGAQRL